MSDNMTDLGNLMAELNQGEEKDMDPNSRAREPEKEVTMVKEIITDMAGHKQIRFLSLQEVLQMQMKAEVEAHEDENFEGDGIYGFTAGKQKDGAMAHRFSFYERVGGNVRKFEYR